MTFRLTLFIGVFVSSCVYAGGKAPSANTPAFSTPEERCIIPASLFHGVNYHVLRAILSIESGLVAHQTNLNTDGSVDVGIAQTNSIHFADLAKVGVSPESLQNVCVSTYVAAWQLRKHIARHGNTFSAIARYHSATPEHNQRYQVLLRNELIRAGVIAGTIQKVPSVSSNKTAPNSFMASSSVMFDQQTLR